jgi:hypothetical protein
MVHWLTRWIQAADTYQEAHFSGARNAADLVIEYTPRALAIVRTEMPEIDSLYYQEHGSLHLEEGRTVAVTVRGIIRSKELTEHYLGGTAPRLSADLLHPLVWDAARTFWSDGYRRAAVQQACIALNAWIQERLGRTDVSDGGLMAQAFSTSDPEDGKPRLRWPGDQTDRTVRSMQSGILQYAQGCFSAIRNPSAHSPSELDESTALIQLASLSQLAAWTEQCSVVTTRSPEPPF